MFKRFAQQSLSICRSDVLRLSTSTRPLLAGRIESNLSINSYASNHSQTTSADHELSQFLSQDIKEERKLSKNPSNGPGVPGFEVTTNGSEIILRRSYKNEQITIKMNVNGTVEGEPEEYLEEEPAKEQDELTAEMRSLPDFLVEIRKNGTSSALVFSCGFLNERVDEAEQQDKADLFEIHNFFVLENNASIESEQVNEKVYLGDGQLIDGQLYDLLMDYLDERGIGIEFGEHLIEYATYYEHSQYVSLLERINNFIQSK